MYISSGSCTPGVDLLRCGIIVYYTFVMSADEESTSLYSAAVLEQDRWSFSEWTSAPLVAEVPDEDGLECYESGSCSSESSRSVHLLSGNAYVRKLLQSADLHILQ